MQAAIYARFSTDKQSDSSVEDQARNCRRYAAHYGGEIVAQYADKAISGASNERPEFNAMLAAAMRGEFDTLLVDDLSRLSRRRTVTMQIIERFKFRSIRIVGVSDGYDSLAKGEKIQSTMRGLMNELYLDDLREKTHRGLYGKALNGYSAGGRTYGYKRVPIENPAKLDADGRPEILAVKREINEDEAKWVRQIFRWFAEGNSPKRIAAMLNERDIPSPRKSTWAASAIYGHKKKGSGILNNQLYIGRYIWNRSEWVKDPDTGKRRRMDRDESEWVITDMPELRIIPQELWDRVQIRQDEINQSSENLRRVLNNPKTRSRSGKYLFSGLLRCGCCGANYTMCSGTSYGCSTNINRGDAACSNRLRMPRKLLESNVLDLIREDLLSEEAVELFIREAAVILKEKQTEQTPADNAQKKALADIEQQIENIASAIRAGIITSTTKAELEKAEAQRNKLQQAIKLDSRAKMGIAKALPDAVRRYKDMVGNLRKSLYTDVSHARTCLKAILGTIRLVPDVEHNCLEAELRHSAKGLMQLTFSNDVKVSMVAGVGFEPTTFRL